MTATLWLVIVVTLAGAAAPLLLYAVPIGAKARQIEAQRRRCVAQGAVALTYDDGPGPTLTDEVLAALAEFDARATFFLLGMRAAAAPGVIDRVREAGHELACHGQAHLHAWKAPPWRSRRDMEQGYDTLRQWIGPDALFRPPYGKWTLPTMLACRRRGARAAWWTVDGGDTHDRLPDPERIASAVASAGGGVVLLHDFDRAPEDERDERHAHVLATTRAVLRVAKERGLRVVTMSELLSDAAKGAA